MSFERKIPVKSTPFSYLPLSDIGSLKRSIYPCKISNQQAQATLQQSRNGPVLQLYQYRHCCNCVHTTASLLFTIYSWTRHALKKDLSIALLQRSGTQVSTYRQHSLYWFLEGVRKCKNISGLCWIPGSFSIFPCIRLKFLYLFLIVPQIDALKTTRLSKLFPFNPLFLAGIPVPKLRVLVDV